MCFVKSQSIRENDESALENLVSRKEADASLTKNTSATQQGSYEQNIRTSAIGLKDEAKVNRKTLLGE